MLKNYLKVASRNLLKHKTYSLINIAGLAIGLACCLLILLYVRDELSYDRFHQNAERIYRVLWEVPTPVAPVSATTPMVLAPKLQEIFPEIREVVRLDIYGKVTITQGEKQFTETRFFLSDPSLFNVFSFKLLHGDIKTALVEPYSVILTASAARRYFGEENPMQQQLEVVGKGRFKVTGVMADVPQQSHVHFDFLASMSSLGEIKSPWEHWGCTYVLLHENTSPALLEKKFKDTFTTLDENVKALGWGVEKMQFNLQPLADIHLRSNFSGELEANSDIRYIYIFSGIALVILLIACVNYMNMATAKSAHRAREVGIRKVVGSIRLSLIVQFLSEAVLLSGVAVGLALILVELFLPAFNSLVQKQLAVDYFQNGWLVLGCAGLALLAGIVSGSYPAFYLSSFQPVHVLRGIRPRGAGAIGLRRVLVLLQFIAAIGLITGTVVIQQQLEYFRSKKLGFDRANVIVLPIWGTTIQKKHAAFKNELLKHPAILRVAAGSGGPIDGAGVVSSLENSRLQIMMADADYLPTLDIALAAGRNFSSNFGADSGAFLLNETAVALLGWKKPLEETFAGGFGIEKGPVIGVVKDFHNKSLHAPIEPMVFQYMPKRFTTLLLKVAPQNLSVTLEFIKQKWQAFEPVRPFEFSFLHDDFDKLYRSEQRMGKFFVSFSTLAIFIACLGLFGLTAFIAEQRTKEIGIRKVLGATVTNVVGLLSKDFVKLVMIANLLAWPLAYWVMQQWLQDFANRIDLSWWMFALAGGLALLIALLTVSTQAIKAALANPVEALRYE